MSDVLKYIFNKLRDVSRDSLDMLRHHTTVPSSSDVGKKILNFEFYTYFMNLKKNILCLLEFSTKLTKLLISAN